MQESSVMSAHAGELSSASSCRRAHLYSKRSANAGAHLCQLMQESSALSAHVEELSSDQRGQLSFAQEVSSCRSSTLPAHSGELSSASSCRRAQLFQLMQEISALTKEVSSAHAGELSSDQRGQFGQMSSATAHPLRPL